MCLRYTKQTVKDLEDIKTFFSKIVFIRVIFMPVVMESDRIAIIFINPGSGNHRMPEIMPDIFCQGFWIAFVWFCIDIEAFLVFPVTACFHLFKRVAGPVLHFIQKCGTESYCLRQGRNGFCSGKGLTLAFRSVDSRTWPAERGAPQLIIFSTFSMTESRV